jgi:hypothetical protein
LNDRRATRTRPVTPDGFPESLITRWVSINPDASVVEPVTDCLGDETCCECPECHEQRLCAFEDIRAKYDWHPDIMAEAEAVERSYYGGHWLADWYYDFFDIELFGRMRLLDESVDRPLPAYADFMDCVAVVSCPFCFADHRHVLGHGMPLDRPLSAPCAGMAGGLYLLHDDWTVLIQELCKWGEQSSKARAAA